MVDLHDYDIELIEEEILCKNNDNRHDYSDCDFFAVLTQGHD